MDDYGRSNAATVLVAAVKPNVRRIRQPVRDKSSADGANMKLSPIMAVEHFSVTIRGYVPGETSRAMLNEHGAAHGVAVRVGGHFAGFDPATGVAGPTQVDFSFSGAADAVARARTSGGKVIDALAALAQLAN